MNEDFKEFVHSIETAKSVIRRMITEGIINNYDDFIEFIGEDEDESCDCPHCRENEEYLPVGRISDELLKRYLKVINEGELLKEEIAEFRNEESNKILKEMMKRFDHKVKMVEINRKKVWDEISDSLGLSRDEEINIDADTGIVGKKVDEEKVVHLRLVPNKKG